MAPMVHSEARYGFVVVDPIDQVASVALVRLVLQLCGLDHVHGSPRVQEPFTRCFRWMENLDVMIKHCEIIVFLKTAASLHLTSKEPRSIDAATCWTACAEISGSSATEADKDRSACIFSCTACSLIP